MIPELWTRLGQRIAVAGAAATGLISLLWDAAVHVACFRGGLAWLALVLFTRTGRWIIERTLSAGDSRLPAGLGPDGSGS